MRGGQGQAGHEDQEGWAKEGEKGRREQCGKGVVSPGWDWHVRMGVRTVRTRVMQKAKDGRGTRRRGEW